ncbi:copper chaperone PCu(A)C [uncultured Ferrimonas sp.]|uniref:copper chaperone PCu(A)C n=1 Tax=uncultured Ferrimonas sp. TaxID=432640 RepID=UPI00260258FA|nr:copper chaperone PCu(A)C [uncultured Ferrimonas sp.]
MIKRLFEFGVIAGALLWPAAAMAATITVTEPQVRAMPTGVPNTAGYLQLQAQQEDDALLAASCEGVQRTELHTLLMEDGLMKMRPVEQIPLPQGQTVALEQGGYHLMMMGLQHGASVGQQLQCQLSFAKAAPQTVVFTVVRIDKPSGHHHHH